MANVSKELAQVQAQVNAINASIAKASAGPGLARNTEFLQRYAKEVQNARATFAGLVGAQGDFGIQSMRVASQADILSEKIASQRFSLKDLRKEWGNLGEVYRRQMALQKSMVMQWSKNGDNTINADIMTPRGLDVAARTWKDVRREAGFYNQVLASVADQTIKWGKNTQWAGRQLTAGLTMPLAAGAAGMAAVAYQLDKGLTQVVKVYGDASTAAKTSDKEIRDATMSTAKALAGSMGQAATDTIEITSQLAAAGNVGAELQAQTREVSRARVLGELNIQDAMKTTITLQSVYKMNSQQLAETFNFMNSMENQTNLTMQDFTVGIPKVIGVLKEFGGTVQDAGILLAGMKAAGIDAAEGANAIKSISFKIIAPNQGSKDLFQTLTGQSFDQTMAGTDGVVERLVKLSEVIKGLKQEQRVELIQKMFGLYQGSKTLSLLDQLTSGSEQMTRAFDVANQSTEQWAATANREMTKLTESGWMKFQKAWQTLKTSLYEGGEVFLRVGANILGMANNVIKWFDSLPDGIKKTAAWALALGAITGPVIMLVGLMGNLIGNVTKFMTSIVNLGIKFKIINAEQKVAMELAKAQEGFILNEAESYRVLAAQISQATTALTGMMKAQQMANFQAAQVAAGNAVMPHPRTGTMVVPTKTGGYRPAGKNEIAQYEALKAANIPAQKIAENAAVTEKRWAAIKGHAAGFGVVGVAAVTSMATQSGTMINNLANAALIGSTLTPLLGKLAGAGKIGQAFAGMSSMAVGLGRNLATKVAPVTSKIGTLFAGLGPALAGVAPVLLGVGAAAAAAFYIVNKNINQTRKEIEQFTEASKTYAETFGYTYMEAGTSVDAAGNKIETLATKVEKLKAANEGLAKQMTDMIDKNATDAEKMQFAINEGVKARVTGASPEKAQQVAATILRALGSALTDKELLVHVRAQFDFSNMDNVIRQQMKSATDLMSQIANDQTKRGKTETFVRWFTGDNDITASGKGLIDGKVKELYNLYQTASEQEQPRVFAAINEAMSSQATKMFNDFRQKNAPQFKALGIETFNDFLQAANNPENTRIGENGLTKLGLNPEENKQLMLTIDGMKEFNAHWAELAGIKLPGDVINFMTLAASQGASAANGLISVAEAQKQYTEALGRGAAAGREMSDAEKLKLLNTLRANAGLGPAKSLTDGFTGSVQANTEALKENADAAAGAAAWANRFGQGQANADQFVSAMKDYYSGSQQGILDEANRQFDAAMDASLESISNHYDRVKESLQSQQDAMEATFDKRSSAMEKRWDTVFDNFDTKWENRKTSVESYYDARINKIQQAIDIEQKAEEERQRIFEAEKQRISRMAEMYNRNIDISTALNTGNFDQAAKLSNDAQAAQESWLAADSAAASQAGSSTKIEGMQKQIDSLEALRKARLDSLAKQEEAEKKALQAKKEREQEAFEAEKKRYEKSMEIRKKAADQQARVAEAAARREWEANKRALDMEMAALLAYVPRNQKELQDHIKVIESRYAAYGVNLKAKGSGWAKHIADVLRSNMKTATAKMSSDINWSLLGAAAAKNFTEGAFGMNVSQFMKWIETGQMPKSAASKIKTMERRVTNMRSTSGGTTSFHSGGIVGQSAGSRVGFAGKNQSQSEVTINALKGEAVLNRKATRTLGPDIINKVNRGEVPLDTGGPDMLSGLAGVSTGLLGGILRGAMKAGVMQAAENKISRDIAGMQGDFNAKPGSPGRYGNTFFDAAQLRNASIIAATGRSVGASNRDIIVALMTAMQESTLRNIPYGDRDSVGLFQQRNGWGSFADRMNPRESAKMFFLGGHQGQRGLLDFPNRNSMSLAQEAQAVQVSAFPTAYAKWADEASAIMRSMIITSGGTGILAGPGGWLRPVNGPVTSHYGMRVSPTTGQYRLHAGVDLGVPMGTPVRAAKGGRVSFSGTASGYGNYIMIDHGNGISTAYAHESRRAVRAGQTVGRGQVVGYSGTAGTGPHLHFEYLRSGKRLNPNLIIPGLRDGGFTMSDGLANLHNGEAVLTKPLTENLVSGIQSLDKSNHSAYNVVMDFRNSVISKDVDVQDAVEKALFNVDRRLGRNRTVR